MYVYNAVSNTEWSCYTDTDGTRRIKQIWYSNTAFVSAKQEIVLPQVLSPSHLTEILKSSQDSILWDMQVPVMLSKAYLY
jgi:hypothetical protein